MQNITELVDSLEDKLNLLMERYNFLKEENELLHSNVTTLEQQLNNKGHLLEESKTDLHSLRVAKTIQGSNNTKETTKKINTLIKEIDLCIAQLSD